jgi:hypothetical protein
MTLAELEDSLPNGFHDSALKGLSIDYMRRTIRLDMSLKVGDSDGPREQRDDVRDAEIEVSGVVFFVIDPPSPAAGYDFKSPGELWVVDGYETRSIPAFTKKIDKELLDAVPPEAFIHSFFVSDWNSYVHLAARDCSMKWAGTAERYSGRRQAYYPGETIDS